MEIGIVGLGLIGGSLAKALKGSGHTIYGFDSNPTTLNYALMTGTLDGALDSELLPECDFLFIALYPEAAAEYLQINSAYIKKGSIVVDCCGTKRGVCCVGFELAEENGYTFIGGHPMAGSRHSGYKNSRSDLFFGASMILVPKKDEDIRVLKRLKDILLDASFGYVIIASAEEHDRMIAYTSQLAHVVSNAYVKNPLSASHKGYSAGSFKDMTRVARLNEDMWAELFLENKDNLANELDLLISSLEKYKNALENGDGDTLRALLREGNVCGEKAEKE